MNVLEFNVEPVLCSKAESSLLLTDLRVATVRGPDAAMSALPMSQSD